MVLRGPSLTSDVQTMLASDSDYRAELFLQQVAQALQSNVTSRTNDRLEFVVSVGQNKTGGARIKLGAIPYDQLLQTKKLCLVPCSFSHPSTFRKGQIGFCTKTSLRSRI